ILRNPVYCGDLAYGRRTVKPARRRNRQAPARLRRSRPHAYVDGAVPAGGQVPDVSPDPPP
ncbi:MAG: hypothetical protein AAB253_09475, partial [candidate division NC10 bacterium]